MSERQIFEAAIEIPDADRREAFLAQACAGQADLRAAVDSLLRAHMLASSEFLQSPAGNLASPDDTQTIMGTPVDGDEADDSIEQNEATQAVLKLLTPTSKPGSLGRLAHYEILEFLGRGAFGVVLKAFDEKLHRMVAVKMMNPALAATSPPRKRFLREARSSAAVRHENIVAIYAVEEQPVPYLVMEYIPGKTLQQWLDQHGPIEIHEILKFGQQIAAGLAAAHAQGLIHRDIKPANILIDDAVEARAKITDFGLARAVDDASMTQSGLIAGTPMYMAPEQARGQTLDHRTDLFSLGSVLYTMASGHPPFRASNTIAVLRRVCEDTPRPISEIISGSPQWLETIVTKLHQKEPDDRYQTAKEVAEMFARCQSELQLTGQVTCVTGSNPASGAASAPRVPTPAKDSEGSRPPLATKPSLKLVLFAMLLGVLVMSPILFGRHLSDRFNSWFWPPIPALPTTELATGLNFDGKDDHVEFAPVEWSYPQFTIEAFVTSTLRSDNGITVSLTSGGKPWEFMELYDGPHNGNGQRQSGAQIMGKTPYATAYGPLTPGVRQHRALVFDGSHMHYYINGLWQGKRRAEAYEGMKWKRWNLKQLRLGSDGDGKKRFEGQIDQVRISKIARYNDNFAPVTSVASDEQTLALYDFAQGSGDVLKDISGHGHDGKIVGATWVNPASGAASAPRVPATPTTSGGSRPPLAQSWHGWPADAPAPAIAPFDAEQAQQHQEAWAKYLNVPVEYTNSLGMKFRLIPPGEFLMGSTAEEIAATLKECDPTDTRRQECIQSEAPQHKVILTQPIYLGVNEVTQAEYEKVMGVNPSYYAPMGMGKDAVAGLATAEHPVEMVNWYDAAEFCAKLSQQEKLKPFYFRAGESITTLDGTGYRLPSEAEWEFACRAGTTTKYWIGDKDEDLARASWFIGNAGYRTHAVGELTANPFGLADIHGNVWEWVQDGWDATYYGQFQEKPAIDPHSPFRADSLHVTRGGSHAVNEPGCRSSYRFDFFPIYAERYGGFRVSLPVDAVKAAIANRESKPVTATGWHGWPAQAPAPAIAPFNAEQANRHQEDWAAYLKVPVEYTNSLGMKFRLIPPGEFLMGSTKEEIEATARVLDDPQWLETLNSEAPQHKVILTQPFYLGMHEVTQGQYAPVMGQNPAFFSATGTGKEAVVGIDTTRFPVEMVSWDEASEYCQKLSQSEQLELAATEADNGYRLPTEAEWEWACRAGTLSQFSTGEGEDNLQKAAWFEANSEKFLHPVGERAASPFGLHDTHGNVWEWVQDGWEPGAYTQSGDQPAINPVIRTAIENKRMYRGGSWFTNASSCRSGSHRGGVSTYQSYFLGFRVALPVDAVRAALKLIGPAMSQPVASNPDRSLAEWVISKGGSVQLDGETGTIDKASDLPTEAFQLNSIALTAPDCLTDADFERLRGVQTLDTVFVIGTQPGVTNDGFRRLADVIPPSLTTLSFYGNLPNVTDAVVSDLNRLVHVKTLHVPAPQFTNAGLEKLNLPNLSGLNLAYSQATLLGLKDAKDRLPSLNQLLFENNPILSTELPNLSQWSFNTLVLTGIGIRDQDLPLLHSQTSLAGLELRANPGVTDAGIPHILAFQKLQLLGLTGTGVSDAGISQLKALPELSYLRADYLSLTDAGIASISEFPKLGRLHIIGTKAITDVALEHLAKCPTLHTLHIQECPQLTEAGVRKLQLALPNCRITSDFPELRAVPPIVSASLSFDGVDDSVEIPTLHPPDGPLTIEVWAETAAESTGMLVSLSQEKRQASLWYGDQVGMTQEFSDGRQLAAQSATPTSIRGKLHHYAGVWDGQKIQIFLDGVPVPAAQSVNNQHWADIPDGTNLGRVTGTVDGVARSVFLKGQLHSVRISSGARYAAAFTPTVGWKTDEQTLALYDCSQASGETLKDLSGHGHDGKIIGATWVPGSQAAITPASDAIDYAAERQVAEWAIGAKARFNVKAAGQVIDITDVSQLPSGPFHIHAIVLTPQSTFGPSDFAQIGRLRGMILVGFQEPLTDGSCLVEVAKVKSLQGLQLQRAQITDAHLSALTGLTNLTELDLNFTPIGDAGMGAVSQLTSLKRLFLGESRVGDEGLAKLKKLSQLESLHLGATVTDQGLGHLANLPKLHAVHGLKSHHLKEVGIGHLQQMPNVTTLNVVAATDEDLVRLKPLAHLTSLVFNYHQFSPSGLETLGEFPKLDSLSLGDLPSVDDSYWPPLVKLNTLRYLLLQNVQVTAEGIAKFREQRPEVLLHVNGQVYPATK